MPKLRNAGSDIGKFVQWLGRKCRNHNPLAELQIASISERNKLPGIYTAKSKGQLSIPANNESILLYEFGNRCFEISVREVSPVDYASTKRVQVAG